MKTFLPFFLLLIMLPAIAEADIYIKAKAAGGLGITETWTSGKKQKSETSTSLGTGFLSKQIVITRADKGVIWEMDETLRVYQETPLPIPYTPDNIRLTSEEKRQKEEFFKKLKEGSAALDEDPCSKFKNAGTKVIAGIQTEGFAPACPERGFGATVWMALANDSKAAKIQKEVEFFEKAKMESQYSLYPPKEKEETMTMMLALGKGMSQGLVGTASPTNMPERLIMAMESAGTGADDQPIQGMLYEVVELDQRPADTAMFEIPAGYAKVENLGTAQGEHMMAQMASGDVKLSDMLGNAAQMGEQMGLGPVKNEGGDAENLEMLDAMGKAVMQGVQEEIKIQGANVKVPENIISGQPASSAQAAENVLQNNSLQNQAQAGEAALLRQQFPTRAPEAWQQGLYDQPVPAAGNNAGFQAPSIPPPIASQGNGNYPQENQPQPQLPSQNQRMPQQVPASNKAAGTLGQINQMLQNIQGITSQFGGITNGGFMGLPQDYQEGSYDSPETYDSGSGGSEEYYEEGPGENAEDGEIVEETVTRTVRRYRNNADGSQADAGSEDESSDYEEESESGDETAEEDQSGAEESLRLNQIMNQLRQNLPQ